MTSRRDRTAVRGDGWTRRRVLRHALAGAAAFGVSAALVGEEPPAAAPPGTTRIAFGSCLRHSDDAAILEAVVGWRPDLFLWLGDNIYGDTDDMAVLRRKYAVLGANPRFAALLAACPNLAMWDDHDFRADDAGGDHPRKRESQREFLDFWRVPADDPRRTRDGIHHAVVRGAPGRRVQVVMLDGRFFRSPKTARSRLGHEGTMLGDDQWAWLAARLREPAELRLLCSGIQAVNTDYAPAGEECWAEFPHERERLFATIRAARADGVVLLSGDMHFAELSRDADALPYPAWELTSSGLDQRGRVMANRRRVGEAVDDWNFGTVVVDWAAAAPTVTLGIVDAEGRDRLRQVVGLSELRS